MTNNHIDYIEFGAADLEAVKTFYNRCFGWHFTDYGPDYASFDQSGVTGGFHRTDQPASQGVLVVLYHDDLEAVQAEMDALTRSPFRWVRAFATRARGAARHRTAGRQPCRGRSSIRGRR